MREVAVCLIHFSVLFAAFERIPQSPSQVGAGLTYSSTEQPAVDFLTHPASMAYAQRFGSMVYYASPFQLKLLRQVGASIVIPHEWANVGIAFASLGMELYRETTLFLGGGRRLGKQMDVGILIATYQLSIKNYGSDWTVGVTASVNYSLMESLRWSLIYRNLNSPRLGTSRELLPQVAVMGFTFLPTSSLTTSMELERDLNLESRYKFGVRWRPHDILAVSTGFVSHPGQVTAGISLRLGGQSSKPSANISYAIATHPELAISQVFALHLSLP